MTRPLPYDFEIQDDVFNSSLQIKMKNKGKATGVFLIYDLKEPVNPPKKYTVEPKKEIIDHWSLNGIYNYSLHGPNGFVRKFSGFVGSSLKKVEFEASVKEEKLFFLLNPLTKNCSFLIKDESLMGSFGEWNSENIPAGELAVKVIEIEETGYWYDFSVKGLCEDGDESFYRRFMGHLEVNKVSITDPAMGKNQGLVGEKHPEVPEIYRRIDPGILQRTCLKRRSRHKDECWELMHSEQE